MLKCLLGNVNRSLAMAACGFVVMACAIGDRAWSQQLQNWRTFETEEILAAPALPPREVLEGISVDPELRALTQKLDDPSFATREKATHELLAREFDRNQIYAILEFDQLSAEQRYRLLEAIRESLMNMPRGALGIQMQQLQFARGPIEVRVQDLLPGLPAEKVLRVGDAITAFNGEPLRTHTDLQYRIQSKKPGDMVRLNVKRIRVNEEGQAVFDENNQPQYDMLEIDVELGSAELLGNQGNAGFGDTSLVQRQRLREAAEVANNYAPQAREVVIKGFVATPVRPAERVAVSQGNESIDNHPFIRRLIADRAIIQQGRRELTPAWLQKWKLELQYLQEEAQAADVTPEERIYRFRVVQRFAEILNQE